MTQTEHVSEDHDCAICCEPLGTNRGEKTTRCRHKFCAGCLGKWEEQSDSCPMCRQSLDNPIHRSQRSQVNTLLEIFDERSRSIVANRVQSQDLHGQLTTLERHIASARQLASVICRETRHTHHAAISREILRRINHDRDQLPLNLDELDSNEPALHELNDGLTEMQIRVESYHRALDQLRTVVRVQGINGSRTQQQTEARGQLQPEAQHVPQRNAQPQQSAQNVSQALDGLWPSRHQRSLRRTTTVGLRSRRLRSNESESALATRV